jgi:hypothetical protein
MHKVLGLIPAGGRGKEKKKGDVSENELKLFIE